VAETFLKYQLTPKQATILRSLGDRVIEASPTEVAVSALMSPAEVRSGLTKLAELGLARQKKVTYSVDEPAFEISGDGRAVVRTLPPGKGSFPVGTVTRVAPRMPRILEWMTGTAPAYLEIVSDDVV